MRKTLFISTLLVLGTFAVYLQTLSFSFVGFDDPELILENFHVRPGITKEGLVWAFVSAWRENVFFYPLSLVTHMADCSLFGDHAGGHHLSSLFFHTGTVVLLFFLLASLTQAPWRSGFAAAVFAVHPLGADSVAWVAERSNVLCGLLWMATMLAYVRCRRSDGGPRRAWYFASLLLFCLALLAKSSAVTLPVIMLLADWLMLGRFKRASGNSRAAVPGPVLTEKIPFFLLAGIRAGANLIVPVTTGAAVSAAGASPSLRLANGLAAYPVYIRRLFAPYDLSVYYPFPDAVALWKPAAAVALLAVITILLFYRRHERPMALFGWLWFLVALVPTLGFVQSGPWPAMADHYVYIPMIGLLAALTWIVPEKRLAAGTRSGRILAVGAVLAVTAAGISGFYQTRHYRDSVTLFERAVKVTNDNFFALTGLGNAYAEQGDMEKAQAAFNTALSLKPESPGAHNNMGLILAARGETQKAMACFTEALTIDPAFAPAHIGMGNLLLRNNRPETAMGHYRKALAVDPDLVSAHNNLALALAASGRADEAVAGLRRAIGRFPHSRELLQTLARLLEETGGNP